MKAPVFLERQGYRRRRLQDLARVTPVLALFFFMVPLMGQQQFGEGMASLLVYFFVVWALIILVAFFVARALRRLEERDQIEGEER